MKNKYCILFGVFSLLAAVLLFLLIQQNKALKKELSTQPSYPIPLQTIRTLSFEKTIERNYLFQKLPFSLDINNLKFPGDLLRSSLNGFIVMIFDTTVCGKCLSDELMRLKGYTAILEKNKIGVFAIIGVTDKNEENQITAMHRVGELSLPFKFVHPDKIYRNFKLKKGEFLDTPFYLFTSNDFKIFDIHKSPYMQSEELEYWLTSITNQTIL